MSERERALSHEGPAAPPRANGELVFAEPWESRVFGLTLALCDTGRFEWSEFQSRLIDAIARREAEIGDPKSHDYYECWLEAFRVLVTERGWLDAGALEALEFELAAREPGHDH